MSIRLTTAERLLKGSIELLTGESKLPSAADYPVLRGHLDLSLGQAWRSEWWDDLMQTEERYFRADWAAATTYSKADEVYDPYSRKYFQSLRNTNLNHAPTVLSGSAYVENSAYWAESRTSYSGNTWVTGTVYAVGDKVYYAVTNRYYQCHTAHTASATLVPDATSANERWGLLTPFQRSIDFDATGETAIGDVFDVKDSDPRVNPRWRSLVWSKAQNNVYVAEEAVRCWVQFRSRRPRLKGAAYDATSTYVAGDMMYFDGDGTIDGNFYQAIDEVAAGETPITTPLVWSVVEIPELFEGYLIWSAYAKMLVGDQQDDRKLAAEATAEGFLEVEADNTYRQQGGTPSLPVRTY